MFNKTVGLFVLLASLSASGLHAGTLTNYALGDVLLCFRSSSVNDLVVDIGPVSTFTNTTVNQHIPISAYTGTQLALVGTNGTSWSAFSWFDDTVPANAQGTLFITHGRANPYVQSAPYYSNPALQQLLVVGYMQSVQAGAAGVKNFNAVNTSNAIVEPDDSVNSPNPNYGNSNGNSYDYEVNGYSGNADFDGNFQANIEKSTPSSFTTNHTVVRSDFYWIPPNGTVKFLGYFEFNTNGAMTFVAKPTLPTVTTLAASGVGTTNAQLNATVNPNFDSTTFFFQYGLTTSYGSNSVASSIGTTSGTYGLSVSNLLSGMTYHFRAAAYNSVGTNFGSDLTFTTAGGGALVTPVIKNILRSNNVSYVSFTTGNSGNYTLRGTNSAGLGVNWTNWPPIASIAGNGVTNTLSDTTSISNKFYLISAQ